MNLQVQLDSWVSNLSPASANRLNMGVESERYKSAYGFSRYYNRSITYTNCLRDFCYLQIWPLFVNGGTTYRLIVIK